MKKTIPLFFAGVIAIVAIAVKFLPWWALLLGVVALVVIGKLMAKRIFFRLILTPFKLKGAVLKGATAEVHSVTPMAEPPLREPAPANAAPRHSYYVEVTIRPAGDAKTPFGLWEAGELRLVLPESVLDLNPDTPSDNDDTCEIKSLEVQEDGAFKVDEGLKYPGPQRLRLLIAVKPGTSRLKFRYYFEEFGTVTLPAAPVAQAA